ncbi:DUF2235 domain-containing protein [Pseudomonas sp. WJP1]|uniref:phospholipase effector Tle1 domain-containing protein n=1 Tax=Pseudomonas sp. WJP1 TaxID=2986947 RepID=UPI00234AF608|nr:DUF2235 domain-containing protein [Pseudomonas sp. WJP1]WCM48524.1 DUF2235 domain-containing protein [Pseudomonas sp. WJP1]
MPSLRLILLFDGTDNTPKDRTNVWRTYGLLAEKDVNGVPQKKEYITGVGTDVGELVRGSIFGQGVARKIREGYEWLVENYQDDTEIYVFGFSRGAFAARSLVQMIAICGLARPDTLKEWSTKEIFDRYADISQQDSEVIRPMWRLRYWQGHPTEAPPGWHPDRLEARLIDDVYVRAVKIRMAGLWDTVGAIDADALQNKDAHRGKSAAHNVRPTRAQGYGHHALAIDEHRPMFEASLWRAFAETGKEAQTLDDFTECYEQRWFIGAHSDVGGGYQDDDLPNITLQWMMQKATALGLAFTHTIEPRPGAWHDPIHDSFKAFAGQILNIWDEIKNGDQRNYRDIGRLPRSIVTSGGTAGSLCTINETIDDSVLRRWQEDPTYRPPKLVEYFVRNPGELPHGTTTAQRTQRIYAEKYWNPTGVFLRAGVRYRAHVVPGVGEPLRDLKYIARSIDGEDWDSVAHRAASLVHGKRKDDAKWFALIGTVDKYHPWVMKDGGEFTVPVSGQMLCYFNDVQIELGFYDNNSGWVMLEIERL